jgi:mercuric ion transport protein
VVLPGIGASVLPKLICPACWPAYAGLLSTAGLGFLISAAYLLPLTTVFLALAVAALGFRANTRHGYGPFQLGLIAATAILLGKFVRDSALLVYGAVGLLMLASAWNAWPRRNAPCCENPRPKFTTKRRLQ